MAILMNLEWPSDTGYTSGLQGLHSLFDLLSWDPEENKPVPTQHVYHQDDQGQYIHLRTNEVKKLCAHNLYEIHI